MRISDWSSDVCSSDLAGDLGYIAGHARATVVAGRTACATARSRAAELDLASDFPCVVLGERGVPGPGSTQSLRLWQDLPPLQIVEHRHSAIDPTDLLTGGLPLLYVPELTSYIEHLDTDPREIRSEEPTSEIQSLMRISSAVLCMK